MPARLMCHTTKAFEEFSLRVWLQVPAIDDAVHAPRNCLPQLKSELKALAFGTRCHTALSQTLHCPAAYISIVMHSLEWPLCNCLAHMVSMWPAAHAAGLCRRELLAKGCASKWVPSSRGLQGHSFLRSEQTALRDLPREVAHLDASNGHHQVALVLPSLGPADLCQVSAKHTQPEMVRFQHLCSPAFLQAAAGLPPAVPCYPAAPQTDVPCLQVSAGA